MSPRLRRFFVVFVLVPIVLFAAAYLVTVVAYSKYTRSLYEFLAFLLVADLAVGLRGSWRNTATVVAATIFGLAAIEFASAMTEANDAHYARGFSVSRPVLGWGPSAPGVYHSYKTAANGKLIYSVDYTIDDHLLRRTLSGSAEPAVAFFGGSFTFGEGLADSETLPQDYADLTGRKTRVLNFGFLGYGPQQFLRALQTGMFDPLLRGTKRFVYLTVAWHAGRASCRDDFMARAPRYELRGGDPVFVGPCRQGLARFFQDAFLSSASFRRFLRIADSVGRGDVEIYLAELRRCAELVKQKYGGRLIVLYMSGSNPYLAKSGFTDAQIKERLRQSGIEVIDATLSPKDFPPGTALSIPGDGHPTAIANRARAVLLKNYLAKTTPSPAAGQ
ncbi:MAG: SGNH/GDSL hydrolase family protein [Methylovirgula sp.]